MIPWLAIVNPAAGLPGAAGDCASRLKARGLVARAEFTAQPGDATRIARASRDMAGIIAVGGDGTVQEILAGLDRDRQVLAIMPVGHGNCLARDLDMRTVARAMAALAAPRTRNIDLVQVRFLRPGGTWTSVLAASTLAVGYVANVVDRGRHGLPWLGRAAYAAASAMTRPRRLAMDLAIDGQYGDRGLRTGLVVNNTCHLANFRAFRGARLDDGLLDIMETDAGWGRQQAHNTALLMGSERFGPARQYQARRIELRLERPATLMVDGELLPGVTALKATCLREACRCLDLRP